MCVIIAKPSGTKAPEIKTINAAMQTNPHGFALTYAKDGELHTFRTMKADEMREYYIKNLSLFNVVPFVFHARISTHGSRTLENCHGWSTDGGHAAFFHNGILSIKNRGNMTDSETFLRDIYEPCAKMGPEAARRAVNAVIGGSKFAFIRDSGGITMYGHYFKVNGVYYSNLNHVHTAPAWGKPSKYPIPNYTLNDYYNDLDRFGF